MKLWIDDKRPMPDDYDIHVYTVEDAIQHISKGIISHVGFDNDLGEGLREGYELACWIEEQAYYGNINSMTYSIQSDNSSARPRIRQAMENAIKFWKERI